MKKTIYTIATIICSHFISCNKQDEWLDIKSNKADVILSTSKDYQAILDNMTTFNDYLASFGEICTDNISADLALWQQSDLYVRNGYIFADRIFDDPSFCPVNWSGPYRRIARSNIVVEGIEKIRDDTPDLEYANILGSSLFFRAFQYFSLAQEFCVPYNSSNATKELGIPIRMTTDINEKSVRPILQTNYDYVLDDLEKAESLLPDLPSYQSRPSKFAARALLARVYLTMGKYEEALDYAEKALSIYNYLIDFNTLNKTAQYPFSTFPDNREIIFYANNASYSLTFHRDNSIVSMELFDLYHISDLRKTVFFTKGNSNNIQFKGQYTGDSRTFAGFATNELYLIKSEALARLDKTELAMQTLNDLLVKRWTNGQFVPLQAENSENALRIILNERRKEIPFLFNMRWQDLRRLNQDLRFAKRVIHNVDGTDYILEPNSSKYVFDIPAYEINLSGIQQNKR